MKKEFTFKSTEIKNEVNLYIPSIDMKTPKTCFKWKKGMVDFLQTGSGLNSEAIPTCPLFNFKGKYVLPVPFEIKRFFCL